MNILSTSARYALYATAVYQIGRHITKLTAETALCYLNITSPTVQKLSEIKTFLPIDQAPCAAKGALLVTVAAIALIQICKKKPQQRFTPRPPSEPKPVSKMDQLKRAPRPPSMFFEKPPVSD